MSRMEEFRLFAALRASPFVRLLILCAGILYTSGQGTAWAQQATDEYHAKAAFVFHFAQLVQWPSDASGNGNLLMICTLGDDPFNGELENTIAGKQVGTRIVQIRHLGTQQSTVACNVLFIGKSVGKRIPSLISGLRNTPILTIGESDDFLKANGMIRLCLEGKKIRFEVNREAAELARLKVSSQLLLLAKTVVERNGGR